ncbi:MAG: SUMF1/EgtB/PvdO family nonheme iron enzyme [Chloroflexota bacterium]
MPVDSRHVTPEQLLRLREAMATRFNVEELRLLCQRLGIDPEELRPGPKSVFILALIQHLQRRDRLPDLIRALYVERPQIDWAFYYSDRPPVLARPPFPGLRAFTTDESDIYFGRRSDVARLVQRLREGLFVAVVGVSGSGKSSLLQAGLIPAWRDRPILADGTRPPEDSDAWLVSSFVPTADPLGQLALAFTRDLPTTRETADVRAHLVEAPDAALLYARKLLDRGRQPRLLLILDQFEELFTQGREESERQAFTGALAALVEGPSPVSLVIGLRDHFFGRCFEYPALRRLLERPQLLLGPLSREDFTQAIIGPAERNGWHWEPGLVETLLDDLGASGARSPEPGALPLMAHALREIWNRRQGDKLTLAAYQATGNVKEALGRAADRVYDDLPADQQAVARALFLRLVRVVDSSDSRTGVYARQRVALSALMPADESAAALTAAVETLAAERLVTLGQDAAGRETVEPAHEALFSHWPRLAGWLAENRETIRLRQTLGEQIQAWERSGHHADYLYGGEQLAETERLLPGATLVGPERDFLAASRAKRRSEIERLERELATQRQLTRRTRLFLAAVSLIAIVLAAGPLQRSYWRGRALSGSELTHIPALALPADDCADAERFRALCATAAAGGPDGGIAPFAIETYEVDNARYTLCVRAGACTTPNSPLYADPQRVAYPVQGINGLQAAAYCRWLGRQLPTVLQWEAALWGTEPSATARHELGPVDRVVHTAASGAVNLLGNVSEWTRSYETEEPREYRTALWDGAAVSLSFTTPLVVRGDSWLNSATGSYFNGRVDVETFGVRCVSVSD